MTRGKALCDVLIQAYNEEPRVFTMEQREACVLEIDDVDVTFVGYKIGDHHRIMVCVSSSKIFSVALPIVHHQTDNLTPYENFVKLIGGDFVGLVWNEAHQTVEIAYKINITLFTLTVLSQCPPMSAFGKMTC